MIADLEKKEQKTKIIIYLIGQKYFPKENRNFKVTELINVLKNFVLVIVAFLCLNVLISWKE